MNQKIKIVKKYITKDYRIKMFIYCHPDMNIKNDIIKRVNWCRDNKVLPYIMRDISCYSSPNNNFYVDLASYCNQIALYKKMPWVVFLTKRHPKNPNRIKKSASYLIK